MCYCVASLGFVLSLVPDRDAAVVTIRIAAGHGRRIGIANTPLLPDIFWKL